MSDTRKTALVVSAHSADFVWRAGGAIALHASKGWHVHIVCLSFGERGESAKLWKKPGMTLEQVKKDRQREAEEAAAILGATVEFLDIGDYPMRADLDVVFKLAEVYRKLRPAFVLSHSLKDPYNFDHPLATHVAQEARVVAQAHGHEPQVPVIGAPPVKVGGANVTVACPLLEVTALIVGGPGTTAATENICVTCDAGA